MAKLASIVFTTQKQDLPEGRTAGGFAVSLLLAGAQVGEPTVVQSPAEPVHLTISAPGAYTVSVVRVDTNNAPIGDAAVSDTFTIVPDQIDVPATVTVILGDVPVAPAVEVPAAVAVAVQ